MKFSGKKLLILLLLLGSVVFCLAAVFWMRLPRDLEGEEGRKYLGEGLRKAVVTKVELKPVPGQVMAVVGPPRCELYQRAIVDSYTYSPFPKDSEAVPAYMELAMTVLLRIRTKQNDRTKVVVVGWAGEEEFYVNATPFIINEFSSETLRALVVDDLARNGYEYVDGNWQ